MLMLFVFLLFVCWKDVAAHANHVVFLLASTNHSNAVKAEHTEKSETLL